MPTYLQDSTWEANSRHCLKDQLRLLGRKLNRGGQEEDLCDDHALIGALEEERWVHEGQGGREYEYQGVWRAVLAMGTFRTEGWGTPAIPK